LLYDVLICQDIARGYQIKGISLRCILKIDLQKAFDFVHWGFIQEMLTALKFPLQFTKWIMACVTSLQFSIHINCQVSEPFEGGKCLRQGDPLSPLLFVLSMEYLSRLLKQASKQHDFRFHAHCKVLGLTHLIFADDLILFCKAHPVSLQHIMTALQEF